VNIGLELMAKPTALFLDEPTSGLDASSALLVMMSLKQMVEIQGVTICSVIHQPRKFIFDLFDSLLLLGVGGRMVYHGPVDASLNYFTSLGYKLPPGESLADWLIDISSGRIAVEDIPGQTVVSDELGDEEKANRFARQPSRGLSLRNTALSKRFTKTAEQANVSGISISQDTTMMIQEPLRRDVHVVTKAGPSGAKADRAETRGQG
jgi:ABC-type multidrug transport system ATPase subunit